MSLCIAKAKDRSQTSLVIWGGLSTAIWGASGSFLRIFISDIYIYLFY